jgi:predicted nucleic acid-binding protein
VTYLVDTDWTADYLVDERGAVALLDRLADQGLAISIITYGEIYEGIIFGRDSRQRAADFRKFLRIVDVLPLNQSIMRRFAEIRGTLRREGRIIGDPDLLIAATAIHHGMSLLTRNVRHFDRVPDLKLNQYERN